MMGGALKIILGLSLILKKKKQFWSYSIKKLEEIPEVNFFNFLCFDLFHFPPVDWNLFLKV